MNDAAVGGGHGVEGHVAVIVDGALGHALGQIAELTLTALAVLFDVDNHAPRTGLALVEDHVGDELEGAEGLAAAADEQACVVSLDVDDGELVAVGAGTADGRGGVDVQLFEDAGNDTEGGAGAPVVVSEEPDAYSRGLGADAEDARAATAKNVDLDFVAAYAEFEGCELDRFLHGLRCADEALVFHRLPPCPVGLR